MTELTIDSRSQAPKLIQLALATMIGAFAAGIVVLDLPVKWKAALVVTIGFVSLAAMVRDPKGVSLSAVALISAFSIGTGIPPLLVRPHHIGLSVAVFIQLGDILILALFMGHLARMAIHRVEFLFYPSITVPALAWILASAASAGNAQDPALSFIQLFHMCRLLIGGVIVANVIKEPKDARWLLSGLLLGVAFQGLLGSYQAIAARPLGLEFLGEATDTFPIGLDTGAAFRASGTIGHPNGYAMYLAALLPFGLAILFSGARKGQKMLAGCVLALGGMGLVLSLSRGGWVAFTLASFVVLGLAVRGGRVRIQVLVAAAVVVALVLLGLALTSPDVIASRIRSDDRGAAVSRLTQAQGALRMLSDSPVIGIGLNNWALRVREYGMASVARYGGAVIVHNIYLLIAAETGITGLLAFLWLLSALMEHTRRILTQPAGEMSWVTGAGLAAGLVALAVHGMVDYDLLANLRVFSLLWLFAAMVASISFSEGPGERRFPISRAGNAATLFERAPRP